MCSQYFKISIYKAILFPKSNRSTTKYKKSMKIKTKMIYNPIIQRNLPLLFWVFPSSLSVCASKSQVSKPFCEGPDSKHLRLGEA